MYIGIIATITSDLLKKADFQIFFCPYIEFSQLNLQSADLVWAVADSHLNAGFH